MPRIARVVVPGMPHHVTQRGNRGVDVFVDDSDRRRYLTLLSGHARTHGLRIWAYCLMTNHVHLIAVPEAAESLGCALRNTHHHHASRVNRKVGESGHLWQGRFYSCVLDDDHLWAAVRYVERNPVRARLVTRAEDWPWSSAAAHCGLCHAPILSQIQMPWPVGDWAAYLRQEDDTQVKMIRQRTRTGRPCGSQSFVKGLESLLGRALAAGKRGPRPRAKAVREGPEQ